MKQNKNRKINKTNIKRITLGGVGVIATAGAVFGITTLLGANNKKETLFKVANGNAYAQWVGGTAIVGTPPSSGPTDIKWPEMATGGIPNAIQFDQSGSEITNRLKGALDYFHPKFTQEGGYYVNYNGPRFVGDIRKPRMFIGAGGSGFSNTFGIKLQDKISLNTSNFAGLKVDEIKAAYSIEGEAKSYRIDFEKPYIDFDLASWFNAHPDRTPKITFYIFTDLDAGTGTLSGQNYAKHGSSYTLESVKIPRKNETMHFDGSHFVTSPEDGVFVSVGASGAISGFASGFNQAGANYQAWTGTAKGYADLPALPADVIPKITFDMSSSNNDHRLHIEQPLTYAEAQAKHFEYQYSLGHGVWTSATLLNSMENSSVFADGNESITWKIVPTAGYILDPSSPALNGIDLHISDADNLEGWYTPISAVEAYKVTDFPFPNFANVTDIPMPTLKITDSKNYTIDDANKFGLDYKFALSGNRKWDGTKEEITFAEFESMRTNGKLPNLYDWKTKTWTDIIAIATAKSKTSPAKERRVTFVRPAGTKGIISKADLPTDAQTDIKKLMSTITGADSANYTIAEKIPAGSALGIEYSIDGGQNWKTAAQLHTDAPNLFNPKANPWFPLYILQRIKIIDQDVEFASDVYQTASQLFKPDSTQTVWFNIKNHPSSSQALFFISKIRINKMVLPDEFNPVITKTSTTGDWSFDSFTSSSLKPDVVFEYTFENDWTNPSLIFTSDNKQSMDKLAALNFYDFANSKLKTLHWRIKHGSKLPYERTTVDGITWSGNPALTYTSSENLSYLDKSGDIVMDPTTKVTIKKTDFESSDNYSTFRPTIIGTSSKYEIKEPTIPGFTYKYKIDGSSEIYVDKTTFLNNHADLLDPATGNIKGIDYQVTTTGNIFIIENSNPTQVIEGLKVNLTDISVVPHIKDSGTTENWDFISSNNQNKYEFTFESDWTVAKNNGEIYSQEDSISNTGVLSALGYVNAAGKHLNSQNLYDFVNGSYRTLHWRIKGSTTLDANNSGDVSLLKNLPIEISADNLRKLFPVINGITPVPNVSRLDPTISGNANHYALRDGEALLSSTTNQVKGFHIEYKLDSEADNLWKQSNDFKNSHVDVTDFTDPQNPKVKNIVWKLVPDAGSSISITYPTGFKGWPVPGLTNVIPTETIHVLAPHTNINIGTQPTARNVLVELDANQVHSDKVQLLVATDQDIKNGSITWTKLADALNDRMNFFGQRGSSLLSTLYWKATLIDTNNSGGFRIDPTQTTAIDLTTGTYGEFGQISLSNLRYLTTELPKVPTVATDSTTGVNARWTIETDAASHYEILYQLDDDQTDAHGQPIWLDMSHFIAKYNSVLWDKAIAGVKVNWSASLNTSYRYDGTLDASATHGQVGLKTGATIIKALAKPTIDWKDKADRPTGKHYSDSYSMHEEVNNQKVHFEYSINGSSDWLVQKDFETKYPNLYVAGNGVEGKMLTIYWRAIPDDGVIFDPLVTRQGNITIDHIWKPDNVEVLKVVQHVRPTWNPLDSVSAYKLADFSNDHSTSYKYQTTNILNDPNSQSLLADEFMKQHTPIIQWVKTVDANGNSVSEAKLLPLYYTAQPAPGYFFSDYKTGKEQPMEIVVTAQPVPKPVVLPTGAIVWPIGWIHDDKYDVYVGPTTGDKLPEVWFKDPVDNKYKEVTKPTKILDHMWFPKEYTYDKTTNEYKSPDGTETWVQNPDTKDWQLKGTGEASKDNSMPIWEIIAIAAGGAVVLGAVGFLIYRYIKKKKMDY